MSEGTEGNESARERVIEETSSLIDDASDMMRRANAETTERARALRGEVEAKLLAAKLRLQEIEGEAVDRARVYARVTDDYVHDNPWQAIGIAAAVGFVAGLLMNRR